MTPTLVGPSLLATGYKCTECNTVCRKCDEDTTCKVVEELELYDMVADNYNVTLEALPGKT